ncbi:MAG TPA: hypothetical protein DCZ94_20590 [Lentisphaeria bacterium]|nr:MAG: hypothetical protein A2X48_16435 [Lentisphaerae bacterium GWF2_49_21]HBC89345.1 hypothetical protein [Lentisphaeria bacterium]
MQQKTKVSAVNCESYDLPLLEEKIRTAVELAGGWPEKIKPGAKVLLKPNLLSAKTPDQCVTTHPELVRAVIRELRKKGVEKITIADSPAGIYTWEELWEKTGMKKVADEEKVELLPLENFERVEVPGHGYIPLLKELKDFDVFISLPKLKTHILTKITVAVKNSYGLIVGESKSAFHATAPSPRKMSNLIAAVYGKIKPDFVIVDAIESMQGDGPANGKPFKSGIVMAGYDAVAIDACACTAYGYKPQDIQLLVKVAELGFGDIRRENIDLVGDAAERLGKLKIPRSKSDILHRFPESMFHMLTLIMTYRPFIIQETCIKCGKCFKACSQKAILSEGGSFRVLKKKCILCMCCLEACPVKAVELRSPFQKFMAFLNLFKKKS